MGTSKREHEKKLKSFQMLVKVNFKFKISFMFVELTNLVKIHDDLIELLRGAVFKQLEH